jgi:hypothetical protein
VPPDRPWTTGPTRGRDHVPLIEADSPAILELIEWTEDRLAGAEECESVTALAADLASVAAAVDTTSIRVRAAAARADALTHPGDRDLESLAAALAAETASSDRLHALVASLDRNVHRLVAQLTDAVNQAVAVAFGSTRYADLRSLVEQLEALREALAAWLTAPRSSVPRPGPAAQLAIDPRWWEDAVRHNESLRPKDFPGFLADEVRGQGFNSTWVSPVHDHASGKVIGRVVLWVRTTFERNLGTDGALRPTQRLASLVIADELRRTDLAIRPW